jgi:MSHA biogenesis protein MshK
MAEYVMLICLALLPASYALAQELSDPTRPPAVSAVPDDNGKRAESAEPVLQSVLISSQRREAIVSGRTVKVGDRVGEARVVGIAEDQVVLRSGAGLQALKLFPDVQKRASQRQSGIRTDGRQH